MEDVKMISSQCQVCSKIKPRFCRPVNPPLVKATQALERLSVDFKGPLPSTSKNNYILTVVDEFSRFPWAFPCSNMTSETVINCLNEIYTLCGQSHYVHSDNGPALISKELDQYLLKYGIGHSFTSVYNPQGMDSVNG